MRAVLAALFFLAQPFWEAKSPDQWTDRELDLLRNSSPWAQTVGPNPEVLVFLATARPMMAAEDETRVRASKPAPRPDVDYLDYVREYGDRQFVLAIRYPDSRRLGDEEQRRMEQESEMLIGKKPYKIVGSFPPSPGDPVLRLLFPRAAKSTDKSVLFRLYLPGVPFPEREVEFRIKDMCVKGELEM